MASDRKGEKWNREETILAFDLYCRTPFGKISSNNKDIIELASLLGRTPGSVSMKMSNLASCDPELQSRGISGLLNKSKFDEIIYKEFCKDLGELSYQALIIKAEMQNFNPQDFIVKEEFVDIRPGEYREQTIKERVGQYLFRKAVLSSYDNRCCITGIHEPELLIASHIKPWKDCDDHTERTNPRNGLCLNAFHDRAFDKGFITLSFDYKVIVSDKIKDIEMDNETKAWLSKYKGEEIKFPEKKRFIPAREFIEYHQDVVFEKWKK